MKAVELILVRHGETEWNHLRRIQGQIDVPLNAIGLRQAQAAAARLAPLGIDALYTSDLARASQTAAPIASACGIVGVPDTRLRERHFGRFEGSFYEVLARDDPDRHARLLSRDLGFDLDGGETIPALHARVCAAIASIVGRHAGERVVVVTHGGVLDCAYRLATGLALDAPRPVGLFNASLNTLRHDDDGYRVVDWGDVGHLDSAADEIDPRRRPSSRVGQGKPR